MATPWATKEVRAVEVSAPKLLGVLEELRHAEPLWVPTADKGARGEGGKEQGEPVGLAKPKADAVHIDGCAVPGDEPAFGQRPRRKALT